MKSKNGQKYFAAIIVATAAVLPAPVAKANEWVAGKISVLSD